MNPVRPVSLLALALVAGANAECPPTATLTPTTPYFQQTFGASAAFFLGVDGMHDLLIGAPRDTVGNTGTAGSVSVFHFDGAAWGFSQLLNAPAGASCDFGHDIAVSAAVAAIGASGSDGGCDDGGAVYFTETNYQNFTWTAPVRFVAPGTQSSDWVGRSVSIIDNFPGQIDWMIAGAPGDDSDLSLPAGEETQDSGAVHVWRRIDNSPWTYSQKLRRTAPTNALAAAQEFGGSVALTGNVLIAGARSAELNVGESNAGCVMVYTVNGANQWVSQTGNGYHHPLTTSGDGYGWSVAGSGGVMVVGAPRGDSTATDTPLVGAKTDCGYIEILILGQNGVESAGRIFPPDATAGLGFGYQVTIGPSPEILVGTQVPNGKIYVYRKSGNSWNQWALARVLHNSRQNTSFGASLASTYDWIAAPDDGEPYNIQGGIKGIAYLYKTNQYIDAADSCARASYSPLDAEGTYTGCSTEYTLGAYTTCGGTQSAQGPDLFYAFTPRCTGPMVADTIGSAFDTVLSVHSACPPDINPNNPNALTNTIACNDDIDISNGNTQSRVYFNAVEGQMYIFRIAGYGGASGDYVFNFHALATPANDNCTQPQVLSLGATPYVTCGCTTDGPTDSIAACDFQPANPHRDIWFRHTANAPGTLTADTCDANFRSMLQAFAAGACPASNAEALACGYDNGGCQNSYAARMSFNVAAGASYLLRVASPHVEIFATTGYGTLSLSFLPARCPCDWNQSGAVSVQDIFDFLASYFAGTGDFNNSGATTVQDIFDFLACYFGGCA